MQEAWVQSLGWDDPLEKGMATHSSILPGKFCGQRSTTGYCPCIRKRVGHDVVTKQQPVFILSATFPSKGGHAHSLSSVQASQACDFIFRFLAPSKCSVTLSKLRKSRCQHFRAGQKCNLE